MALYDAILSVLYRKRDDVISLESCLRGVKKKEKKAFSGITSNATFMVVVIDYLSLQVNYDTML